MVSVCMITYGHEQFIQQAIEGVLMQNVEFDVELIIADDNSPDYTEQVVLDIINNNPKGKWIKYTKHKINKGMMPNFIWALEECNGKYIALCEGDDYWTDPYKLQKQVDFLEKHQDYSICAGVAREFHEKDRFSKYFPDIKANTTYSIEDFIFGNLTGTCTLIFNTNYLRLIPDWFNKVSFGDWALVLTLMHKSNRKIMVLNEKIGCYRIHENGIYSNLLKDNVSLIKAYKMQLDFIHTISKNLFNKNEFSKEVIINKISIYSHISKLYRGINTFYRFLYFILHILNRILLKFSL